MSNDPYDSAVLSSRNSWLMMEQTRALLGELEEAQSNFLDIAMTEARGMSHQPNAAKIISCLIYAGSCKELIEKIRKGP